MIRRAGMMRSSAFCGALMLALAFLMGPAGAEDGPSYREYSLGEIVVSGQRSVVREIAVSNEIETEDFEALNAGSVADVLTHVPGVQVTYSRQYKPEFTIHGFDRSRVLTLIDGVPYYEVKYGGMDLSQIGLESVARIDVVKGAPSVLYGPNAMGGVVNIITKAPTEKTHLAAKVEYGLSGLDDAYKASLSHGRKVGDFSYWLGYSRRERDSWDLSGDFEPRIGTIDAKPPRSDPYEVIENGGERANSDYRTDNFRGKVGFEPSGNTEVYLDFHHIKTERGDPPNLDSVMVRPFFSRFDRIPAYEDRGLDISAKQAFSDRFDLQAKLYYHDHSDEYASYEDDTYSEPLAVSTYKDDVLGGMLLGEYRPAQWNTLRLALHYKKDTHEQRAFDHFPFAESYAYTSSIGLENEMNLLDDKLGLVLGAGYDRFDVKKAEAEKEKDPEKHSNLIDAGASATRNEFNPMIGATYRVCDSIGFFASVARKTRFPSLDEIYGSEKPNLELAAETAVNYTAGVSWRYRDLLELEVAPFLHDISDFITTEVPEELNPDTKHINYNEVEMKGVEIESVVTPCAGLRFKLGYMYNDAQNKSPGRVSEDVTGVPEYTFNVGVRYIVPVTGTELNLNMLYSGTSYSQLPTPAEPGLEVLENESYKLCNLKITQPFLDDRLQAFLAAENLLDEHYEPVRGYPAPGMSIWLGMAYEM